MRVSIENNSQQVLDVLARLSDRLTEPELLLELMGKPLVASSKQRFRDTVAPDGRKWLPNSRTTLALYFGGKGGLSKKPLTGKTRQLQSTLTYQVWGNQLLVGSPLPYAAMQQLGGTTASGSMIPGKRIPARPFLGVSESDEETILDIVAKYLGP